MQNSKIDIKWQMEDNNTYHCHYYYYCNNNNNYYYYYYTIIIITTIIVIQMEVSMAYRYHCYYNPDGSFNRFTQSLLLL